MRWPLGLEFHRGPAEVKHALEMMTVALCPTSMGHLMLCESDSTGDGRTVFEATYKIDTEEGISEEEFLKAFKPVLVSTCTARELRPAALYGHSCLSSDILHGMDQINTPA